MGIDAPPPPGEPANLVVALSLAAKGLAVFPVHSGGPKAKAPMPFFRWRDQSSTDAATIREWWRRWPDAAPALDVGKSGLFVVDADRHDPEHDGVEAWSGIMAEAGASPDGIPIVATPNDGSHWIFRQSGGLRNSKGRLPKGVDVRGDGGYIVAPGAVMADGRMYELAGDLDTAPPVPDWLTKWLEKGEEGAAGLSDKEGLKPLPQRALSPAGTHANFASVRTETSLDEIHDLLSHIPSDVGYHEWVQVLMALHAATGGSSDGLSLADAWSAGGSKYKAGEVARKWRSFKSQGINGATIAAIAQQFGADLSAIRIRHLPPLPEVTAEEEAQSRAIVANMTVGGKKVFAARQLLQHDDGTLTDEDGVIVEAKLPAATAPPSDTPFPPGLVGEIAEWIVGTALKPQPAISIAAALTIVGCAAGRQFQGPTGAGTALYVLGLAPTAQGKDTPLKQIGRVMQGAGLTMHLGPDEFMSFSAVVNTMKRKPLCLAPMDEFGDFMRRVFDRKGSIHARAIPKVLRSLWGANFDMVATAEWADRPSEPLPAPHLSIFGVSTHEQFYTALENGAVADGTLNRFLIVEGVRRPKRVKPDVEREIVPQTIIDGVRGVYLASGEMPALSRNDVSANPADHGRTRRIGWGPGAERAWEAFGAEVEQRMFDVPAEADLLGRTVEMAVRIATIVAAGRGSASVSVEDIAFGIDLARQSADTMIAGAADFMAENEQEANWQKIVRMIRDGGGRVVYRSIFNRMRHMRSRDLRELLAHMVDTGVIVEEEVTSSSGGHKAKWYAVE
ncbi:bifunctional DNA primase/polymerase [Jiella avicenniae]|uniref:Bifunctional DNA primase/polymerase n=1 Tax=Jiella avicenniae TaxID=2907202 RepID=A0A9X1P382_9HYPH|nr:bifunctional DNA primase/polymerase [Jiella avicenniae]MCE7028461.1 bifunctional DNA primase/polymerase [Jiella avicenniae]